MGVFKFGQAGSIAVISAEYGSSEQKVLALH
jgi:hypothetical protein